MLTAEEKLAIGKAIDAALRASGVRKVDVANEVNKGWQTVNAWCKGKHLPSASDMAVVARLTKRPELRLLLETPANAQSEADPVWEAVKSTPDYQMAPDWAHEALEWFRKEAPIPRDAEVSEEVYHRLLFAMQAIKNDSK